MNLKKFTALALSAVFIALCFTGCGGFGGRQGDGVLTITLGLRNVEQITRGLENEFPDINFVIEPVYSVNRSAYLRKMLVTDNTADIFFYGTGLDKTEASEHLLDLSGCDFIGNYDRAVINASLYDGHIYSIPGPVQIRGMAYNKTLFEEHGWKKPESHRELVELCRQIREETDDITPIAMSIGGEAYPFTLVTTLSQAGFLSTPAGEEWESRFMAGEASVKEGWGEGLQMTAELIDAGAFEPEKYVGIWDSAAAEKEFLVGKAAMFTMWGGQAALLQALEENDGYEFAFMPFYGLHEGEEIIGANPSFTWGLAKRLGEKGNEKKLENALKVLEWFSTPEGQDAMMPYITDENGNEKPSLAEVSPLTAANDPDFSSHYFVELWELADKGKKMPMIYSGYESVIVDGGAVIKDAMLKGSSEGMIDEFVRVVDGDYKDYLAGGEAAVISTVTESFTDAQTAQLLANGINEARLGDFVLITHSGITEKGIFNSHGAGCNYFAGTISNTDYNIVLSDAQNIRTLQLTGAQVKKLLNEGKRVYSERDKTEYHDFPYYWAGIDVTQKDGAAVSVKLNGEELGDNTLYKVVFCNADYTEELAKTAEPADTGVSIGELWYDYAAAHPTIEPPEVLRD